MPRPPFPKRLSVKMPIDPEGHYIRKQCAAQGFVRRMIGLSALSLMAQEQPEEPFEPGMTAALSYQERPLFDYYGKSSPS